VLAEDSRQARPTWTMEARGRRHAGDHPMRTLLFLTAIIAFLLASAVAPAGCIMDPNGRCDSGDPQPVINAGCIMDPSGCHGV
ncbi:MAG TPA: hypothetical protein DD490_26985, partial [Acidobacteria bacterium]|nr:hypothetical protein [Acidobacteriota bacterium]